MFCDNIAYKLRKNQWKGPIYDKLVNNVSGTEKYLSEL